MAVKKRTNLRAKVAARANTSTKSTPNQQVELPEDPKAFLHEYKESKKDKQQSRHQGFLQKLSAKNDLDAGNISKSSLRRRKRKQKQELTPKMQDLLTSLEETEFKEEPEVQSTKLKNINIVNKPDFIENITKRKNQPNPQNRKGSKKIEHVERQHFANVLKDKQFKQSPFSALRQSIANGLKNEI